MTKQKAKDTLRKILEMDMQDLSVFVQKLFLNKDDIQEKVFKVLLDACDLRSAYLMDRLTKNADIEMSELRMGEV